MFLLAADDLRRLLADSGARAVVTTSEFLDKVRQAVTGLDPEPFVICTDSGTDGVVSLAELEAAPAGPIVPRADGDLAALLYTGGTTGQAKGVMLRTRRCTTSAAPPTRPRTSRGSLARW